MNMRRSCRLLRATNDRQLTFAALRRELALPGRVDRLEVLLPSQLNARVIDALNEGQRPERAVDLVFCGTAGVDDVC